MSKKRRITPAMIRSAIGNNKAVETGRISLTGCNEANTPKSETVDDIEQFFIDVFSGKRAPVAKGRFSAKSGQIQNIPRSELANKCPLRHKNPQVQQIPREDLVNMDYAVIEQRVVAMHPALAAPYGQTEKDQSDDQ